MRARRSIRCIRTTGLQEAGFEPVVAAPEQRLYQMVLHEVKPGWTITKEWEGYTLQGRRRV